MNKLYRFLATSVTALTFYACKPEAPIEPNIEQNPCVRLYGKLLRATTAEQVMDSWITVSEKLYLAGSGECCTPIEDIVKATNPQRRECQCRLEEMTE